ncbi:MAG TPA: phosphate signaling complex protein PhoU [Chthoniobacterales bacterium]|jgi:phosphate transport system protein
MPSNGPHILNSFEAALQSLRNNVLMMASLTERNLANATKGLFERDDELSNVVIADDEEIDQLEILVDRDGVDVLMRYQPVASDLRQVVTSMKSSVNIERIADQAVNIARRARKLTAVPEIAIVHSLEPMFALATSMFADAIKAYADEDAEIGRQLKPRDKELDEMNRNFAEACTERMAEEPHLIPSYLNLIFVARFIERIGDHAANMGEDVVFSVAAEEIRHTQGAAPIA